ncbi:hypothetical protein [uncultured Anaerococcus sp.]|uniref:YncE family protein n=1 Tax=uncultured Anaerococcus sp. TaxID=293428 RepID=UPI0025D34DEF|nr:hypothetical protein [uncultured Anaerococcus sp.]
MIKKRVKFIILLIIVLLFPIGCQRMNKDSYTNLESELDVTEKISKDLYECNEISFKDLEINEASGMEIDDDKIYISDSDSNDVKIFDKSFKNIGLINMDAIAKPSLISSYENKLAILDEVSFKIVVFDKKSMKQLLTIDLPSIKEDSFYQDMDMNNDEIFITMHTVEFDDAKIYKVDLKDSKVTSIKDDFLGNVYSEGENTYFINSMEAYHESDREGFRGGENHIYSLKKGELVDIGKLIGSSYPGDFFQSDGGFYVYTAGWSAIDFYDKKCSYKHSLVSFDSSDIQAILKGNSSHMYLLMPNEKRLFEIKRK